jgi:chromosome partitioning protein
VANVILDQLKTDERYQNLVFDTAVRANTTIAESAEVGKPVVFYRSGSYGAKDYKALAEEVVSM